MTTTSLRFTPYAWAKLRFMCESASTEIGGYGLTDEDDELLVTDFLLVKQVTSSTSVDFDSQDRNRMLAEMDAEGIPPRRCTRVWIHTHPEGVNRPSGFDDVIFRKNFSGQDFAVMFIMARGSENGVYARARLEYKGRVFQSEMNVEVDWRSADEDEVFDFEEWAEQLKTFVQKVGKAKIEKRKDGKTVVVTRTEAYVDEVGGFADDPKPKKLPERIGFGSFGYRDTLNYPEPILSASAEDDLPWSDDSLVWDSDSDDKSDDLASLTAEVSERWLDDREDDLDAREQALEDWEDDLRRREDDLRQQETRAAFREMEPAYVGGFADDDVDDGYDAEEEGQDGGQPPDRLMREGE